MRQANPIDAINYLKKLKEEKEKSTQEKVGKYELFYLRKEISDLKIENKILRDENNNLLKQIIAYRNMHNKKELKKFTPPLANLIKVSDYKKSMCACCGMVKAKGSMIRIIAGNKNYLVSKSCYSRLKDKYNIKKWAVNG